MRTKALLVVTATLLSALPAVAQDRMPPISPERLTEAQKKAREQFLSSRGVEVFGPFVPLLRSPQLMLSAQAMGDYLRCTDLAHLPVELINRYEAGNVVHLRVAPSRGTAPSLA